MTQPFLETIGYQSTVWPEISITHRHDHLLLQARTSLMTRSNALWGGGISQACSFVNWKAAALQDLPIMDKKGQVATGTTTDAMVIAVSQSDVYPYTHLFAGTATTVGNAIGRVVHQSLYEAAATPGED